MLINLSDAYKVTTIVSYPMEVTGSFTGTDSATSPRMYGTPVISSGTSSAVEDPGKNYSFSSAKVDLDTKPGKSELTFLFYAKNSGDSAVATFDLDYVATNLEHEIGSVPGIADYEASSWLSFLLPTDITANTDNTPLFKELGVTSIPVPLRAFPPAPSMTTQNQQQNLPADPKLSKVLLWDYCYSYVRSTQVQDTVHTVIQVNIDNNNFKMFAVDNSKKLFEVLAQFTTAQENLNNGFNRHLKNVTLQMSPTDETVIQAKGALKTILGLMNAAVMYFPAWVPSGGADITEAGNYYIIRQGSDPKYSDRFRVTIEPDETRPVPYPDLPLPVMHMTDWTTVAADEKNAYWFTTTKGRKIVYLTPQEGEEMTTRHLSIDNLNIFLLMQGGTITDQIVVSQPMLLRTFADIATTEAGIEAFSLSLSKAVTAWFVDQKPNYGPNNKGERNGGFEFDLSIFSKLGTSVHKMPLLRLRNIALHLDDLDSVPANE